MSRGHALVIIFLAALAVVQLSLAPHAALFSGAWFGWINFVNTAALVIALFEKKDHRLSWTAAVWGGMLCDLYSGRFIGFWIAILLAAVALIKFVLKKYVRVPSFW